MEQTWSFEADFPIESRQSIVNKYVEQFDERDTAHAQWIADSIADSSRPLAKHLVLIPVSAHQEASQIPVAIEQYAAQTVDQPFSIVLGLNSPSEQSENPAIVASQQAIETAKRAHPHVDIRTSMTFYDEPTIGTIRRDLWNGALVASLNEGAYADRRDEIIGFNHDIDLITMTPHYIDRVQKHYNQRETAHRSAGMTPTPHAIRSTVLSHAPSLDHPNISKGAYWMDFTTRQAKESYEASIVVPLSTYAQKGGFAVGVKTHETQTLLANDTHARRMIPGTVMQTSPRRYIDRLKYGYENIWTDQSFGANDACRELTVTQDITHAQLEAIIDAQNLPDALSVIATGSINPVIEKYNTQVVSQGTSNAAELLLVAKMDEIISKKIILATSILSRVIHSPRLAKDVAGLYDNIKYRNTVIEKHFLKD